jgi:hypothetical protein
MRENNMLIYKQEINDGLEDAIKANASISIASLANPIMTGSVGYAKKLKALASYNDEDLYYVQSILVTSSWNKNDDIFTKEEVWAAKNTPEDKPTNLEHNENIIIGHIVSNWSITDDGILIDDNTPIENLPDKFHIVTGSVIYKAYSNPDLRERTEKLIAEIENGTKYVSMECIFKGFDYGLLNESNGEYKVLARSEDTSFLTKYLRSYGGSGEYENHKLGRVLRNITFSGKGYVDKPANPDSIIFTQENFNQIESAKNSKKIYSGVSKNSTNIMEVSNMNLEQDIAELKSKVEAASDCNAATKEAYSIANDLKDRVAELEKALTEKEEALSALQASYDELTSSTEAAKKDSEEEMKKKEEMMKKTKSELDEVLEVLAAYKNKEEEMMKKEKKMKRMASLLDNGLDQESAASAVDQFESLEDEAFDAMVKLLAATMKMKDSKDKQKKTETKADIAEVLDNVEPENNVDLSVGSESEVDSVNVTRAALVDFVCARLGKTLNKGE